MSNSNDEPRDGSWVRHKMARELRWVRRNGSALDENGGFNAHTWKALFKAKALGVAIGTSKTSTGAADGFSATYLVVESSMNLGTKHAVIGLDLVADRARIKLRSASNAVDRMHRLGLWNKQERQSEGGEWTSNLYDFSESKNVDVLGEEVTTVLHALKLITTRRSFDRTITRKNKKIVKKATTSRPPARTTVFVWVFDQIILKQACARFTLNELAAGTGLKRRAAKTAMEGLVADGIFVKVGEGAISLREAIGRTNSIVKRVGGPLWTEETLNRDRPAIDKRKQKAVESSMLESADGGPPESADGVPESAYGLPESADGDVLESAYGASESAQGVPEAADILHADSPANNLAEGIPLAESSRRPVLDVDDSVLPVPACASGKPSALPVPSSRVDDLGIPDIPLTLRQQREARIQQAEADAREAAALEALALISRAMEAPGAGLAAQDALVAHVWLAIEHARGRDLRNPPSAQSFGEFAKERRGGMSDETVQGWQALRSRLTPAEIADMVARVNEAVGANPPLPETAVLPMIGPKIVRAEKLGLGFDWVLATFRNPANWSTQSRRPVSISDFGRMATTALKAAEARLAGQKGGSADVNRDA